MFTCVSANTADGPATTTSQKQRDVRPEAHRVPVHRGDDRLLAFEDVIDDLTRLRPEIGSGRIGTDRITRPEVAAGAKRTPHSGQHQHAELSVVREVAAEARELGVHASVDCVQPLRPVQRHDRDARVAALDQHRLVVLLA
jgi:hypothetical protein